MVGLPAAFVGRHPHELSGGQARASAWLARWPDAEAHYRRRANRRTRCLGAGRDPESDESPPEGARPRLSHHHPQPGRRAPHQRRDGDHVYGPLCRTRADGAHLRRARASLYARTAGRRTASRPDRRRQVGRAQGEVPSLARRPSGCEFHTRCPHARPNCRTDAPVPHDMGPGHRVLCHYPLSGDQARVAGRRRCCFHVQHDAVGFERQDLRAGDQQVVACGGQRRIG
ncbi:MAG: hypothetical protein M5U09_13255 [Gammaproteobacteria bacterium]|nr:hypothetical protein [Gammaproteobacteria bacterium]